MYWYGKMVEVVAEPFYLEQECAVIAAAYAHFEEIGQMVIHLAYVVLLGESVGDALV